MGGVVEHLDADGDAEGRFPALSGLRCTLRWVLAADFVHLSRLTSSDAAESAAARQDFLPSKFGVSGWGRGGRRPKHIGGILRDRIRRRVPVARQLDRAEVPRT